MIWGGVVQFFLGESQSHIYSNIYIYVCQKLVGVRRAKFGCGSTVVSKKGEGTDRHTDTQTDKGTLQRREGRGRGRRRERREGRSYLK